MSDTAQPDLLEPTVDEFDELKNLSIAELDYERRRLVGTSAESEELSTDELRRLVAVCRILRTKNSGPPKAVNPKPKATRTKKAPAEQASLDDL